MKPSKKTTTTITTATDGADAGDAACRAPAPTQPQRDKFKRLRGNSASMPPAGASPVPGTIPGLGRSLVPVSAVARHWGISPRRVRQMLEQGRLEGQQQENGYWQVLYPYRYQFGTRGPRIKQQRDLPPVKTFPDGMSRREWLESVREWKQELKEMFD